GRYPVEPQHGLILRSVRSNQLADPQLLIEPGVAAKLLSIVDPAAVRRVHLVVHAVPDSDGRPISQPHAARPAAAWPFPRLVALKPRVDVIRVLHIDRQRVDLTQGQIREMIAGLASVV